MFFNDSEIDSDIGYSWIYDKTKENKVESKEKSFHDVKNVQYLFGPTSINFVSIAHRFPDNMI